MAWQVFAWIGGAMLVVVIYFCALVAATGGSQGQASLRMAEMAGLGD